MGCATRWTSQFKQFDQLLKSKDNIFEVLKNPEAAIGLFY